MIQKNYFNELDLNEKNKLIENVMGISKRLVMSVVGRLVQFYGISFFVGYLKPNPIFWK